MKFLLILPFLCGCIDLDLGENPDRKIEYVMKPLCIMLSVPESTEILDVPWDTLNMGMEVEKNVALDPDFVDSSSTGNGNRDVLFCRNYDFSIPGPTGETVERRRTAFPVAVVIPQPVFYDFVVSLIRGTMEMLLKALRTHGGEDSPTLDAIRFLEEALCDVAGANSDFPCDHNGRDRDDHI